MRPGRAGPQPERRASGMTLACSCLPCQQATRAPAPISNQINQNEWGAFGWGRQSRAFQVGGVGLSGWGFKNALAAARLDGLHHLVALDHLPKHSVLAVEPRRPASAHQREKKERLIKERDKQVVDEQRARRRQLRGKRGARTEQKTHCDTQRKNCEPLVLGPALAMLNTPWPVCFS